MPRPPVNFTHAARWSVSPFPEEDVKGLALRFGFDPSFPLKERLDAAGRMFRAFKREKWPTPRETRERLQLAEKEALAVQSGRADRSEALALLLLRGGILEVLAAHVEHCFERDASLEKVTRAVLPVTFSSEQLQLILETVRRQLRGLRRRQGRPGDPGLRILVRDLAGIWTEGTGRRPTPTWKPITSKWGGRFPEFLLEVAGRVDAGSRSAGSLWHIYDRLRKKK